MLTNADLYDQDLYAWTQEQAALLQAGCFDRLDIPHLVEELQLMGGSERGELANRLIVLLTHLLKLHVAAQHLPMDCSAQVWAGTAPAARNACIRRQVLRRNPSLRRTVPDELVDAYEIARVEAAGDLAVAEQLCPPGAHGGRADLGCRLLARRRAMRAAKLDAL